jgi:glycosyl transferase, family 25
MLPIRYINLDRDELRRARMDAELSKLGLAFERFPAVLWTAISTAEQASLYSESLNAKQFHQPLVNGEKGCYASHLKLWRSLLDSRHEAMIILEDDVCLAPDFALVASAITSIPNAWEMIKLIGRTSLGKAEKVKHREPLCLGYQLLTYHRIPSLTAGYAISRRGAEKLLRTRTPFGRPIDVDLRHWWECEHLLIQGTDPAAIGLDQTSQDSSIGIKSKTRGMHGTWRKFLHKLQYSLNNARHRP